MAPISGYFKGDGVEVMKKMKKKYGKKKGESVFYAVANKNKQTPNQADKVHAKMTRGKK